MSFLFHTASSELKPHRKTPAQDSKAYTHNHKQDGEATAGFITHDSGGFVCSELDTYSGSSKHRPVHSVASRRSRQDHGPSLDLWHNRRSRSFPPPCRDGRKTRTSECTSAAPPGIRRGITGATGGLTNFDSELE
jgi:hypothetical protein